MMLTSDDRAEILSRAGARRDDGVVIVAVAGWYRLADCAGEPRYAPSPAGPGRTLDEAVQAIVDRARREALPGDESSQGHEQAGEQAQAGHGPTIAPTSAPCTVTP